jgi:phosphatidylglycerophosphatase GEP4
MRYGVGQFVNIAGLTSFARVLRNPSLAIPQLSVHSLAQVDWRTLRDSLGVTAVVLDKDNTLTLPYARVLHPSVEAALRDCKQVFGDSAVVMYSNSAGSPDDKDHAEAKVQKSHISRLLVNIQCAGPGKHPSYTRSTTHKAQTARR